MYGAMVTMGEWVRWQLFDAVLLPQLRRAGSKIYGINFPYEQGSPRELVCRATCRQASNKHRANKVIYAKHGSINGIGYQE